MCIQPHIIREVLEAPEKTYTSSGYAGSKDPRFMDQPKKVYTKGAVALVVNPETFTIITVLWAMSEEYSRDDLKKIWEDGGWTDY
jgi:hypothetical protein